MGDFHFIIPPDSRSMTAKSLALVGKALPQPSIQGDARERAGARLRIVPDYPPAPFGFISQDGFYLTEAHFNVNKRNA
jgi:hypothetical protein